ncbi:MAG TPA: hypothetical protein VLI69_07655 [Gammaproteobacteria bacterium]|nr:hypothetical protein [Gammaproteobacteria bacterium]
MAKRSAIKKAKVRPEVEIKEKKKRLTFDIPASLHARLKILAVKRDETMGEIVLKMLEDHLE